MQGWGNGLHEILESEPTMDGLSCKEHFLSFISGIVSFLSLRVSLFHFGFVYIELTPALFGLGP